MAEVLGRNENPIRMKRRNLFAEQCGLRFRLARGINSNTAIKIGGLSGRRIEAFFLPFAANSRERLGRVSRRNPAHDTAIMSAMAEVFEPSQIAASRASARGEMRCAGSQKNPHLPALVRLFLRFQQRANFFIRETLHFREDRRVFIGIRAGEFAKFNRFHHLRDCEFSRIDYVQRKIDADFPFQPR